jgi:DNA primase
MLIVNNWARKYFETQLHEHPEGKSLGLRYFKERGFRDDIIKKFCLGYSPDQRDALYREATGNGYKKEFLEKTGLIVSYDNGGVADRFRGRVIFPVHSLSGKIVAFGGRILRKEDKTAKYLNSPESVIYHKSNELYGIYLAKQAIVRADRCFLVEGYTDVISMHQAGIENVVASSGTALTLQQIRLIRRFTANITVLYDGDAAGIKAALRGIDLILEEGMNVKVVLLPEGEDPDSFARKHNATRLAEFIRQSETDFIRFKTGLLLNEAGNDPIKRSELISDIIRSVSIIPDNIARAVYIRECSSMMEIDEKILLNEVNKRRLNKIEKRPASPVSPAPPQTEKTEPGETPEEKTVPAGEPIRSPFEALELELLRYVVRYGEQIIDEYTDEKTGLPVSIHVAAYIHNELEQDDMTFLTPMYRAMLDEAAAHCREDGYEASRSFLCHPDPAVSRLAADLISEKYQLSKYHTKFQKIKKEEELLRQLIPHALFTFKDACIRQRISGIGIRIKALQETGDQDGVAGLMREQEELNIVKKALNKEIGERIILRM